MDAEDSSRGNKQFFLVLKINIEALPPTGIQPKTFAMNSQGLNRPLYHTFIFLSIFLYNFAYVKLHLHIPLSHPPKKILAPSLGMIGLP